jgi:hypothetical protein
MLSKTPTWLHHRSPPPPGRSGGRGPFWSPGRSGVVCEVPLGPCRRVVARPGDGAGIMSAAATPLPIRWAQAPGPLRQTLPWVPLINGRSGSGLTPTVDAGIMRGQFAVPLDLAEALARVLLQVGATDAMRHETKAVCADRCCSSLQQLLSA